MITTWEALVAATASKKEYLVEIEAAVLKKTGWTQHATYTCCWYRNWPFIPFSDQAVTGVARVNDSDVKVTDVFTAAASLAACNSTPRSFYFDAAAKVLYQNTYGAPEYDPNDWDPRVYAVYFKLFFSYTGKTFNNVFYAPLIKTLPTITRQLPSELVGEAVISSGQVVFSNGASDEFSGLGPFDLIFYSYIWKNKKIAILMGGEDLPYSEYQTVWSGYISEAGKTTASFTLTMRDVISRLSAPVVTATYTLDTYPHLDTGSVGKAIPAVFGYCLNVQPVMIDTTIWKFKVAGHAVASINEIRENGIAISAGAITRDEANGEFTLSSYAGGLVTCDVHGRMNGDTTLMNKYYDIFLYLASTCAGVPEAELDADEILGMASGTYAYPISDSFNILVDSTETTVKQLLDQMSAAVMVWYGVKRSGKLTARGVYLPNIDTSNTMEFTPDTIFEPAESLYFDLLCLTLNNGAMKNWTIQQDLLAASGSRGWAWDYLWCGPVSNIYASIAWGCKENKVINTLLTADYAGHSSLSAGALYFCPLVIVEFSTKALAMSIDLGDVVEITRPRTVFQGTVMNNDFIVIDIREDLQGSRTTIRAYQPYQFPAVNDL